MQWTSHQIKLLCVTDKDTLTSENTKCCRSAFPVGVCYSSIITCLQFVVGPESGQRRRGRKKKSTSHSKGLWVQLFFISLWLNNRQSVGWQAGVYVAGRRMDQTRRGTGAMWQRMCGDTDGDPWKTWGTVWVAKGLPPVPVLWMLQLNGIRHLF